MARLLFCSFPHALWTRSRYGGFHFIHTVHVDHALLLAPGFALWCCFPVPTQVRQRGARSTGTGAESPSSTAPLPPRSPGTRRRSPHASCSHAAPTPAPPFLLSSSRAASFAWLRCVEPFPSVPPQVRQRGGRRAGTGPQALPRLRKHRSGDDALLLVPGFAIWN